MQLLGLWCGRKEFFPGLRLNAMQLRYEPTRSLEDLLSNPLAVEYLKSHCDSDRTLENLWFILDVSWLQELETAEDNEEDPVKRKEIHAAAADVADTILNRYIVDNAPQQINISAGSFEALRQKSSYKRVMFKDAVAEVKLMLDTDILPRFQKTNSYIAMSETIFMDSALEGDESDFSSETVSTAGSVLTDDAVEGDAGGVGNMFAFNFKNLYGSFDANMDTEGSLTYDELSYAATTVTSDAPVTASAAVADTQTTTTGTRVGTDGSAGTSERDSSVVTDSEIGGKKGKTIEPKQIVIGGGGAKKEESDSSSDSSENSSESVSSDSLSSSSTSSSSSSN